MNKFERGGEKNLRETLFGPPIGTLFLHGGRFPGLYMLIGRSGPGHGIFLPIGRFQGGGRRKTRFDFVHASENYRWEYRFMKDIQPYLWKLIQDTIMITISYYDKWKRIEERTGIKPIMPEWDI